MKLPIAAVVGIAVLVLLIIILTTRVKVRLRYKRENENDDFRLQVYIWGGILKKEIIYPAVDVERAFPFPVFKILKRARQRWKILAENSAAFDYEKSARPVNRSGERARGNAGKKKKEERLGLEDIAEFTSDWRRRLQRYRRTYKYIKNRVRLEKFVWSTMVGFDNAAETGIATGVLWALKGTFMATTINNFKATGKKELRVVPNFDNNVLKTEIDCIFDVWIGHVLVAALRRYLHKK